MHLNELFISLAVILVTAGFTTILFKWLRQPLVLGYILTGFLVGSQILISRNVIDEESITLWGEIGVIFLLFALGLEFNFKKLRKVGRSGAVTALIEALFMIPIGFGFGQLMGWSSVQSIFLGGMLSISSTSIVIKSFEDLSLKSKRFTQVVFGTLIAEDIVAVLLMALLTTIGIAGTIDGGAVILELGKLLLFIFLWFSAGIYIFPTLLRRIARFLTDEILLIVVLGLCFAMVVIAAKSGFSVALGAFLMGVIIAETDVQERILRIINPIRQLFSAIFFISVGMLVDAKVLTEYIVPILIISGVVLIIKPLVATLGLFISSQPLKTSIQAGFSLAQIGEFSFIIATVGLNYGILSDNIYPIIVSVSVITTFATPYYMKYSTSLYSGVISLLPTSWRKAAKRDGSLGALSDSNVSSSSYVSRYLITIAINIIWLTAILLFTKGVVAPFIYDNIGTHWSVKLYLALFVLSIMSPFIYALMGKTYKMPEEYRKAWWRLIPLLVRYTISLVYVFIVINNLMANPLFSLAVTVLFIVVFILLSRFISRLYHRMEGRFIHNLDKSKKHKVVDIPHRLNKKLHTEIVNIPHNSVMAGFTIRELHRKYRTGVQILAVHRSNEDIELPSNSINIHSGDMLLVIGDDEQILHFKSCAESVNHKSHITKLSDMKLKHITLSNNSELVGEKCHVSKLHNDFKFILVGYQSDDSEFQRPNPKYTFKEGDKIWVVISDKL